MVFSWSEASAQVTLGVIFFPFSTSSIRFVLILITLVFESLESDSSSSVWLGFICQWSPPFRFSCCLVWSSNEICLRNKSELFEPADEACPWPIVANHWPHAWRLPRNPTTNRQRRTWHMHIVWVRTTPYASTVLWAGSVSIYLCRRGNKNRRKEAPPKKWRERMQNRISSRELQRIYDRRIIISISIVIIIIIIIIIEDKDPGLRFKFNLLTLI